MNAKELLTIFKKKYNIETDEDVQLAKDICEFCDEYTIERGAENYDSIYGVDLDFSKNDNHKYPSWNDEETSLRNYSEMKICCRCENLVRNDDYYMNDMCEECYEEDCKYTAGGRY